MRWPLQKNVGTAPSRHVYSLNSRRIKLMLQQIDAEICGMQN